MVSFFRIFILTLFFYNSAFSVEPSPVPVKLNFTIDNVNKDNSKYLLDNNFSSGILTVRFGIEPDQVTNIKISNDELKSKINTQNLKIENIDSNGPSGFIVHFKFIKNGPLSFQIPKGFLLNDIGDFVAEEVLFESEYIAFPYSKNIEELEPKIYEVHGELPRYSWSDGRVAVPLLYRSPVEMVKIPFEVIDNSCSEALPSDCYFETSFEYYFLKLVWSEHPNASKIGDVVKKVDYSPITGRTLEPAELDFTHESIWYVNIHGIDKNLSKTKLVCPSGYDWISTGFSKRRLLYIQSLEQQADAYNEELRETEPAFISSLFKTNLFLNNDNKLEFNANLFVPSNIIYGNSGIRSFLSYSNLEFRVSHALSDDCQFSVQLDKDQYESLRKLKLNTLKTKEKNYRPFLANDLYFSRVFNVFDLFFSYSLRNTQSGSYENFIVERENE